MARIRYVKPEFFEDTEIAELSFVARLLYIGLWCFMDRQGLVENNAKLIKRNIFPYDNDLATQTVRKYLDELITAGYLFPVEHEGKSLLYCPTFTKNQKLHPGEKSRWQLPSNLLATYKQPTSNPINTRNEIVARAGIGIGIGIGTGTGIGIGTGTGTGTGTDVGDDETIYAAQARLEALRERNKISPIGGRG